MNVVVPGEKGGVLGRVLIRINRESRLDFHMDTDDANAFLLKQGQWVTIRKEDAR